MTNEELKTEIDIELNLIDQTVSELKSIKSDVNSREPSIREKAAAGAFLAQFYNGIENILKRVCKFNNVQIPTGEMWHFEIFKMFCNPAFSTLPELFDASLSSELSAFRKFRHVVHHGYGFQLDWDRMKEGIEKIELITFRLKQSLKSYLNSV